MHASDRYLVQGATLDDLRQSDGTIGYSPTLLHGVTGKGLNDYDRIIDHPGGRGYDGWISIEDGMNGMGEMKRVHRLSQANARPDTLRMTNTYSDANHYSVRQRDPGLRSAMILVSAAQALLQ